VAPQAWGLRVDLDGKEAVKAWAVETLSPNGDGEFGPEDNGKFAVRIHDEVRGLHHLALVYKQKMTIHNIRLDAEGDDILIGKKSFPFKTIEEMVTGLSTDPLPAGWPIRLTYGIEANSGQLAAPGVNASEGDTATEAGHAEQDISAQLASMDSAAQAAALDAAIEAKLASVDEEHAAHMRPEHPTFQIVVEVNGDKVGLGVTKSRSREQSAFVMSVSPDGACARYPVVKVGMELVSVNGTSCSGLSKDAMADAFRDQATVELELRENPAGFRALLSSKSRRRSRRQQIEGQTTSGTSL